MGLFKIQWWADSWVHGTFILLASEHCTFVYDLAEQEKTYDATST
jgi:hypothetical protein